MTDFKKFNLIIGWIVFAIAAFTYISTMEPTASLWDCGEFIATSYKLQVGHPPGAPLFMLIGKVFSLLAGNNLTKVAYMMNMISALSSAFTILFLFWSISYIAKKIVLRNSTETTLTKPQLIAVMGSAVVGALAYTFSDSFWFSAVEAEVYAMSSLFTAVVFWAILKWDEHADEPHSDRWIILIAYLMGLSIGVHLLNLLVIPAIALVYYFRKKSNPTVGGSIAVFVLSGLILLLVMYGIIQGLVGSASGFELLLVNKLGLNFNSGIFMFLVIIALFAFTGLLATYKDDENASKTFFLLNFVLLNIILAGLVTGIILSILMFILYFIVKKDIIKTAIIFYLGILPGLVVWYIFFEKHQNSTLFEKFKKVYNISMLSFIVILIGYSSFAMIIIRSAANPPIDENDPENTFALKSYLNREQYGDRPLIWGQYYDTEVLDQENLYTYVRSGNKYIEVKKTNPKYIYDSKRMCLFPRMYSSSSEHIQAYKNWGNVKANKNPNFVNNLQFFFSYQVGFMYFRYFSWNFIGKQNDDQGHGGPLKGNWLSGIKFFDNAVAPQKNLPDKVKNDPSRNKYFFLPLILGLVGLVYQLSREKKTFWIVFVLFFMTGLAIVVYLNQTPYQPRERDYAYVGSFYAFAIWIGLAVLAAYEGLKSYKDNSAMALGASAILVLVPVLMGFQNWDDHNRSNRYHTVAFASNYLNSCAENAILFTFGDNDTFPLWYAQEVEGIRTDVRDCNLSLFSTDWYANQMKRKAYESDPIPLSIDESKYLVGTRDIVFVKENPNVLFKEKYEANLKEFEPEYIQLYESMLDIIESSQFVELYPSDYKALIAGPNALDIEQFIGFISTLDNNAQKLGIDKGSLKVLKDRTNALAMKIADAYAPIDAVMEFVLSDDPNTKLSYGDEFIDYLPTKKLMIPVDKQKIISLGFIPEKDYDRIEESVKFTLNRQYLLKAQWFILQILAENDWERPIYFATSIGNENYLGLTNYFRLEGFAYRLVPIKTQKKSDVPNEIGEINTDILYDNLMNKFIWGNINSPDFYVDTYVDRTVAVMNVRNVYHRLARALIDEGKNDKAKEVLDRIMEILPDSQIAFDYTVLDLIEDYYLIGDNEKANEIAYIVLDNYTQELNYYSTFKPKQLSLIQREQTIAVYVLQQLYIYATDYKQEDLLMKVAPIFEANYNKANFNFK